MDAEVFMSQINSIVERIAELELLVTVTGAPRPYVLSADPYQPSDATSLRCPFWINEIHLAPAEFLTTGGLEQRKTTVIMNLCIERREGNVNLKYGMKDTVLWSDAAFTLFGGYTRLSHPTTHVKDIPSVIDAVIKNCKPVQYEYGSASFLALAFTMEVIENFSVTVNV
jgi:hypothetical protein